MPLWRSGHLYEHTCFLLREPDSQTNSFLLYPAKDGYLKGGSVRSDYLHRDPVKEKQLVAIKPMITSDFEYVIRGVQLDIHERRLNADRKNDAILERLRAFDSSTRPQTMDPTNESINRQNCEIYVLTVSTPWPDEIQEYREPGSCVVM